jgi:nucleoside-diphosphate-sugar epimerase
MELDLAPVVLDDVFDGADAVIHLAGQPGVQLPWADYFHIYVERNVTASQRSLRRSTGQRYPG